MRSPLQRCSNVEAVEATLAAVALDTCNSFAEVLEQRARHDAKDDDQRERAHGSPGPLSGITVGVKELFDVNGAGNSYGSSVRAGSRSASDAAVVSMLRAAGAIVVGTTRSHEFGWGITTQHHDLPSTRNPWHLDLVPGGSSGGSAAAVSQGLVPLAVGSDTGGSIRIPAAFCGVLGLKTTWGRISRRGGVALAPSFDTPGFLARDPALLIEAFKACARPDPDDPATLIGHRLIAPGRYLPAGAPLRLAIDTSQRRLQFRPNRIAALDDFAREVQRPRIEVSEVVGPEPEEAYAAFVPFQMAEAYDVHHRVLETYPACADLYGGDVRGRLEAAASVTASEYSAAREVGRAVLARYLGLFDDVDAIVNVVGLTGPSTAAEPDVVQSGDRSVPLRDSVMPTTVPQNLAGLPSITVPFGFDDATPVGIQITGPPNSEPMLLQLVTTLHDEGLVQVPRPPSYIEATTT